MSRSSTRNSYVAKRPLMTITYCRNEPLDGIDVHGAQRPKTLISLFHVDIQPHHDVKVQHQQFLAPEFAHFSYFSMLKRHGVGAKCRVLTRFTFPSINAREKHPNTDKGHRTVARLVGTVQRRQTGKNKRCNGSQ